MNNKMSVILVVGIALMVCWLGIPEVIDNHNRNTATSTPVIYAPTEFQQQFWNDQWGEGGSKSDYQLFEDGSARLANGLAGCLIPEWGCVEEAQGGMSEFQKYGQAVLASDDPAREINLLSDGYADVNASQAKWVGCLIKAWGCK